MPCPYFEPQTSVQATEARGGRLPLMREYDGLCHAAPGRMPVPDAMRFECCNHGYSRGVCQHFPRAEQRSCLRYHVIRHTATTLDVLCIEERDYAPARRYEVKYSISSGSIDPEINDVCVRAQVIAFCCGYLALPEVSDIAK